MITVDGVDMPCPSSFSWGLQDVSAAESGRTDDTLMHKNIITYGRNAGKSRGSSIFDTS